MDPPASPPPWLSVVSVPRTELPGTLRWPREIGHHEVGSDLESPQAGVVRFLALEHLGVSVSLGNQVVRTRRLVRRNCQSGRCGVADASVERWNAMGTDWGPDSRVSPASHTELADR